VPPSKNHVSTILEKLHAANRAQADHLAREQGLI
jgi:DNA-binding NarL/FixJ family response regulator